MESRSTSIMSVACRRRLWKDGKQEELLKLRLFTCCILRARFGRGFGDGLDLLLQDIR